MSLRRLPRPVSASVSASVRVSASIVRFAKNVMPKRPMTASSEAQASATARRFSRAKWSEISSTRPSSANRVGTTSVRRPSSSRGRTCLGGSQAA